MGRSGERLLVRDGRRSGLPIAIAIHSTKLGPALGGVRVWSYPRARDGVLDALRLARGMTLKAAAAGLELGGGKGVICAPAEGLDDPRRRRDALLDFGDLVESCGGAYITAEDVGVTPQDIATIAERTAHVTGLSREHGGSGDPSPFTALGVEAAMRACAAARFGTPELGGRTVAIVGLGHVGGNLARRLADAGCELVVADIAPGKRELASELGARWVDVEQAFAWECDLLAPCALGGAISSRTLAQLRCAVVCGAANNQLAADSLAEDLALRGILYAPDFIANAGGLIHVAGEVLGYDGERAVELAEGIEASMTRVLELAENRGVIPLEAARELAVARLGSSVPAAA